MTHCQDCERDFEYRHSLSWWSEEKIGHPESFCIDCLHRRATDMGMTIEWVGLYNRRGNAPLMPPVLGKRADVEKWRDSG